MGYVIYLWHSHSLQYNYLPGAFSSVALPTGIHLVILFYLRFSVVLLDIRSPAATQYVVSVKSSSLIYHGTFRDLFDFP